jgi:hypothetical protein
MFNSLFFWSVLSIVLTVSLFCVQQRVQYLNESILLGLFHGTEFVCFNEMMVGFKENDLKISLGTLRSSYIAYKAYITRGKGPSFQEINQVQSEQDYLRLVKPSFLKNPELFKSIVSNPSHEKNLWSIAETVIFILMLLSSIMLFRLSPK